MLDKVFNQNSLDESFFFFEKVVWMNLIFKNLHNLDESHLILKNIYVYY